MNINDMFPSKYVKSSDLQGKDVAVTIRTITLEEMGAPPDVEEKFVVMFDGKQKGMVLNKTNASTIAGMHGPDTDNWRGKRITLFEARVKAFGKMFDAIRVRSEVPAPKGKLPEPLPEESPDLDDDGTGDDHPFETQPEVEFQVETDGEDWSNRNEALVWAVDSGNVPNMNQAQEAWKLAVNNTLGMGAKVNGHKQLRQVMDTYYVMLNK